MKPFKKFLIKHFSFLVLFTLTLLAVWPLFHAGLIPTHDGEYHLIRFYEFDKMIRMGAIYPRWAPDLDFSYGLPLFTYVYPLPNYAASLFHLFGVSFLDSVKVNMAAATFVGAIFFFFWTKKLWGNMGGLVSSIFYTFAPYHFVDMYVRGSVGEVWALGIFPGFLWAFDSFVQTKKIHYAMLAAVFLALTIFSHNILGLMFFIFAISYTSLQIILIKQKKYVSLGAIGMLLASLALSAIFWIPALFETKYVTGLQVYNIAKNFPDAFQLLFPSWGTGFFDNNLDNQMSVQIGLANLVAVAFGLFAFFYSWRKKRKHEAVRISFFLATFVFLFFCMLPLSLPLWQKIPLMHYFQFPWRLLSLEILVCAFLAGSIFTVKKSKILATMLILFVVGTTLGYTQPAYYMLRDDAYYVQRSNFIDSTNSPGNDFNTIWNHPKQSRPTSLLNNIPIISLQKKSPTNFFATVSIVQEQNTAINISYFPGWHVTIDGRETAPFPNTNGLLVVKVPKGTHLLYIFLEQTAVEQLATYITSATIILLILLVWKSRYNKK